MQLTFFTNIPNHYQVALSQAWSNILGTQYSMVCWEKSINEYNRLGWRQDYTYNWLINAWENEHEYRRAYDLIYSSNIVIWGYAPLKAINRRVARKRLTFCYQERPFKRGRWRILDPRVARLTWNKYVKTNSEYHHLLAVGHHCASDFHFLRLFNGRIWRWGYFPEVPQDISVKDDTHCPTVLWAGRMIPWKRVDLLIRAAAWARDNGANTFRLKLIGYGPEREKLQSLANSLHLADMCEFVESQSPARVGEAMDKAHIYVLPSDRNEGWGVVTNEAMLRNCCVIGNYAAGSIPWLLNDGVNGRIFRSDNPNELGAILRECINNPNLRSTFGASARATSSNFWAPQVAAERLLTLSEALKAGLSSPYQDGGPCSPA